MHRAVLQTAGKCLEKYGAVVVTVRNYPCSFVARCRRLRRRRSSSRRRRSSSSVVGSDGVAECLKVSFTLHRLAE